MDRSRLGINIVLIRIKNILRFFALFKTLSAAKEWEYKKILYNAVRTFEYVWFYVGTNFTLQEIWEWSIQVWKQTQSIQQTSRLWWTCFLFLWKILNNYVNIQNFVLKIRKHQRNKSTHKRVSASLTLSAS